MPTEGRPEPHAKNFGENIESDLALEFLRVVENAAVESARTMGQGDRPLSDSSGHRVDAQDDGHCADARHDCDRRGRAR